MFAGWMDDYVRYFLISIISAEAKLGHLASLSGMRVHGVEETFR